MGGCLKVLCPGRSENMGSLWFMFDSPYTRSTKISSSIQFQVFERPKICEARFDGTICAYNFLTCLIGNTQIDQSAIQNHSRSVNVTLINEVDASVLSKPLFIRVGRGLTALEDHKQPPLQVIDLSMSYLSRHWDLLWRKRCLMLPCNDLVRNISWNPFLFYKFTVHLAHSNFSCKYFVFEFYRWNS